MDNYDELYNSSYGDLGGGNNDFESMFSSLQDSILGQGNDSGVDTSMYSAPVYSASQIPKNTDANGLDLDAKNLALAIRQHESGNNFNAKGASGEHGAYQFMPSTWASWSKKWLGADVPLTQATPQQQNEVAYKQILDWKNQGYNPAQIASLWNSGNPNWAGKVGTNSMGVQYNTPAYVQKVYALYQDLKGKMGYRDWETDRKSTRLNSSHITRSRMPSSA